LTAFAVLNRFRWGEDGGLTNQPAIKSIPASAAAQPKERHGRCTNRASACGRGRGIPRWNSACASASIR